MLIPKRPKQLDFLCDSQQGQGLLNGCFEISIVHRYVLLS
nr:MAG TPA: hypothetical protein [Caudoviricetes sp.]